MFRTLALALLLVEPAGALVLSGPIDQNELYPMIWGPQGTQLRDNFSTRVPGASIWVLGPEYLSGGLPAGLPQIYDAGVLDPRTVIDAALFPYTNDRAIIVPEGNTVFFRKDGIYGAWVIGELTMVPNPTCYYTGPPDPNYVPRCDMTQFTGTWYWSDSPNFTTVPAPKADGLVSFGLLITALWRKLCLFRTN